MARKIPKYDPSLAEARARSRSLHEGYAATMEGLLSQIKLLASSLLSPGGLRILSGGDGALSTRSLEVLLTAELGLVNLRRLQETISKVPKNVPNRCNVIHSELNCAAISLEKCSIYVRLIELMCGMEPSEERCGTEDTNTPKRAAQILSPPVSLCINESCSRRNLSLVGHHGPTLVSVYTLSGPEIAHKYTLRCTSCDYIYNYSMYGRKTSVGEKYYALPRPLIEVSDTTFCDRQVFQLFCCLSLHSWVSFSGFAESYFDFCRRQPKQCIFDRLWPGREDGKPPQLTRRMVSDMYYHGELEEEIRRRDYPDGMTWTFGLSKDRNMYLEHVVATRSINLYNHTPKQGCADIGCGKCWAMDGNWKLCFPHCMFPVKCEVPSLPNIRFPGVCSQQLKPKSAFCVEHFSKATKLGYPTDVRGFLSYCGAQKTAGSMAISSEHEECQPEPDVYDDEVEVIGQALSTIASRATDISYSALKSQGVDTFIQEFPPMAEVYVTPQDPSPGCRKDLGDTKKLRLWSRGHVFIVRPCGHIDLWRPIYRSESPSQVFLIVISWLYKILQNIPESQWGEVILSYDNMCHLDTLRAAVNPLPLPPPYNEMWHKITKVIDDLHIKNHTDEVCLQKYHPKKIHDAKKKFNLMVAEQTFAWLSRYKKILCSMPDKVHHLFFLHRLVCRRNEYTEFCIQNRRKILLPNATASKT